ncbi:hypothetical protein BOX15_Mlig019421g29, partial [Macrostomum lignano]
LLVRSVHSPARRALVGPGVMPARLLIMSGVGLTLLYILWPLLANWLRIGAGGWRWRRRVRRAPPGLVNYGNSCYANCLLQALSSCDAFCADLASRVAWAADVEADNPSATAGLSLSVQLNRLLAGLRGEGRGEGDGDGETRQASGEVDALELLNALRDREWDRTAGQQDAHELLATLLQAVNEELLQAERLRRQPSLTTASAGGPDCVTPEVIEVNHQPEPSSAIVSLRSPPEQRSWVRCGLTQTRVKCLDCGVRSPARLEVQHCVSLCLPTRGDVLLSNGSGPVPLQQLLLRAFRVELIRRARCDRCCQPDDDRTVTLSKTTRLARAPATLVLHLQRAAWSAAHGCPVKSGASVAYPLLLDLRQLMPASPLPSPVDTESPSSGDVDDFTSIVESHRQSIPLANKLYRLVAVIVHYGDDTSEGHYLAYRWHRPTRRWWCISDDSVLPVSESAVLALHDVYMLFYEQLVPSI